MQVKIIGAGLAGCEAALWLADRGVQVELYEQKPAKYSPAHKSAGFAELICSNSLKAERLDSASGLLKEEMRRMGSQLLEAREVLGVLMALGVLMDMVTSLRIRVIRVRCADVLCAVRRLFSSLTAEALSTDAG